jgi:hypothetical protein
MFPRLCNLPLVIWQPYSSKGFRVFEKTLIFVHGLGCSETSSTRRQNSFFSKPGEKDFLKYFLPGLAFLLIF